MRSLRYFEPVRLLTRVRQIGPGRLTTELPFRTRRKLASYVEASKARRRLSNRGFVLDGKDYPYFVHSYGSSWQTERAVEVSLASEFIRAVSGARILEVGNVSRHYIPNSHHDVVDKYDRRRGVISVDVCEFETRVPYDALLSISTFEHVGWDEDPRDPSKICVAFDRLRRLVTADAEVLVTLPIGYNTLLDELIAAGRLPFGNSKFLMRAGPEDWIEVDRDRALDALYGSPFQCANAIYVGRGLQRHDRFDRAHA